MDARVSKADIFLRLPVYAGPHFRKKYKAFLKNHRSISLPSEPYFNQDPELPAIEVTIDCAKKDIPFLLNVIKLAILNVKNPITKVFVVVPFTELSEVTHLIKSQRLNIPINVVCEDDILSKMLRGLIKDFFPDRYGWVVHQFLTLQQILNSETEGILSIDSDTLILRPMAFLDKNKVQVLMESLEYNKPYYEFLNKVNSDYPIDSPTHVTHYSFFQREILESLFEVIQVRDLLGFFHFVELYADRNSPSPFCVDREFYALGLRRYFPSRYTLVKFSNISVLSSEISTDSQVAELSSKYNSVSCHSYLENRL